MLTKQPSITRAHLSALSANLIWAAAYPIYKVIVPHYIGVIPMLFCTVFVAAVMATTSRFFAEVERVERSDWWRFVAAAILISLAKKSFIIWGMLHTNPIDASIVGTLNPLMVLLFSVLFLVDRFTPTKLVGLLLGLIGTVVVILAGGTGQGGAHLSGVLLVLCGVSASAFGLVWLKGLITKYRALTFVQWTYPIAALLLLPFSIEPLLKTDFSQFTPAVWAMFGYMCLLGTFIPNYLITSSMHVLTPLQTNIYTYVQPVAATLISVLFGVATASLVQGVAAVVIFGGVMLVVRSYRESPSRHLHAPH